MGRAAILITVVDLVISVRGLIVRFDDRHVKLYYFTNNKGSFGVIVFYFI